VSLGPVNDALTRETRRVRVVVHTSVCAFSSDHKSRFQVEPRSRNQRHQTPNPCLLFHIIQANWTRHKSIINYDSMSTKLAALALLRLATRDEDPAHMGCLRCMPDSRVRRTMR
jgi:hypothetical protein